VRPRRRGQWLLRWTFNFRVVNVDGQRRFPLGSFRLGKAPAPATDAGANRGLLKGGAVSGLKPGKEASMIQRQWLAAVPVAAWPMLCQQQRPSKRKAMAGSERNRSGGRGEGDGYRGSINDERRCATTWRCDCNATRNLAGHGAVRVQNNGAIPCTRAIRASTPSSQV